MVQLLGKLITNQRRNPIILAGQHSSKLLNKSAENRGYVLLLGPYDAIKYEPLGIVKSIVGERNYKPLLIPVSFSH